MFSLLSDFSSEIHVEYLPSIFVTCSLFLLSKDFFFCQATCHKSWLNNPFENLRMATRNIKTVVPVANLFGGLVPRSGKPRLMDVSCLINQPSRDNPRVPSVILITSCRSFFSTTCYHYRYPLYAPFKSDDKSGQETKEHSKENGSETGSMKVVKVTREFRSEYRKILTVSFSVIPKQKGSSSQAGSGGQKERPKLDISKATTERNFLTPVRAMNEYLLKPEEMGTLRRFTRRSPYENEPPITVYLRRDVEAKALQVWGTWDAMRKELNKRKKMEDSYKETVLNVKKILKDYKRQNDPEERIRREIRETSGRVVAAAIFINTANFVLKSGAWLFTGSHSLFAESIHSLADTINQIILYIGLRKSIQKANETHPYGYHSARYIASLISGVGIFCIGSGLSFYHGIQGLFDPTLQTESLFWAYSILGGSVVSEGGTCWMAFNAIRNGAKKSNMSVKDFSE